MQVVQREEAQGEELLLVDQVAEIGAAEAGARRAAAAFVQWSLVARKPCILEVQPPV